MKIPSEMYDYLSGAKFSNAYSLKLENNRLFRRIDELLSLTKGKKILHVGCCDHIPLIEEKIKSKTWLHGLLEDNCSMVVGVDISKEAVEYVNKRGLSKRPVYHMDLTDEKSLQRLNGYEFDSILMGEIVEHTNNPVSFLQLVNRNMKSTLSFGGDYIITVPNAFSLQRGKGASGMEIINSDHKFWFTPYTISKIMWEAGIKPNELFFVSYAYAGNGMNKYDSKFFRLLEILSHKPSKYKSWRGDQMIIVGTPR